MKDKIILWLWLKIALKDRSVKTYKTYNAFGDIEKIYNASESEYKALSFLKDDDIEALMNKNTQSAIYTFRLCETNHIGIVTIDQDRYPDLLREIDIPPCILFYFGSYDKAMAKPRLTIVGTRECTTYGEIITASLSSAMARSGFAIVTGVAKGIDKTTIDSVIKADGSVIAVLPDGFMVTQFINKYKLKDVQFNGVALTEHLPNESTHRFAYHERNRILSGLSLGTIVTQAPERSGALITSSYALDQGRDVFAVPANIDTVQSFGSNKLLKDGAYLVTGFSDIYNFYKDKLGDAITPCDKMDFPRFYASNAAYDSGFETDRYKRVISPALNKNQQHILSLIGDKETDFTYILVNSDMEVPEIASILSELEEKGIIESCPGNRYKILM